MTNSYLKDKYFRLEKAIGYEYKNLNYLQHALTHRSAKPEHNERLEFLGDSILGMIIAEKLYDNFPGIGEGDLTRMRSTLVREVALAEIAREFKLGDFLIMGQGERKSGGFRRDSILADAVESIIASIYLDCGKDLNVVRDVLMVWYEIRLKNVQTATSQKDPKTQLQEYLQGRKLSLPTYSVVNVSGEDHNQHFTVKLEVCFLKDAIVGYGSSIRRAEQSAASKAMEILRSKDSSK